MHKVSIGESRLYGSTKPAFNQEEIEKFAKIFEKNV